MARRQFDTILLHLRHLIGGTVPEESDGDLLTRFAARQDEAAFETLLVRHGPMVLDVARRVLHNGHDAEDVFQVTFVVLAQQAGSVRKRHQWRAGSMVSPHRTALRARSRRIRRLQQERNGRQAATKRRLTSLRALEPILGEEVNRLPEKFRSAVVLCYFEGKSRKRPPALGWSPDTVKGRLERGRDLLRKRLTRRGMALSAAALATALEQHAVAGTVPSTLVISTLRLATLSGADAGAVLAAPAAALLSGVLRDMYWTKLKVALVLFLGLATLVGGSGWLARHTFAGPASSDGDLVALAPDPIKDNPAADREMKLPIERAVIHQEPGNNQLEATGIVANSWADHRLMGVAFTEATALAKEGKPRVPKGGNLSLLSMGPMLDSPDQVTVKSFVRRGNRLALEVDYTNAVAEGAQLRRNMPNRSSKCPSTFRRRLRAGGELARVAWNPAAISKPQPVKTRNRVHRPRRAGA